MGSGSVGLVLPQLINLCEPLELDCGEVLTQYTLEYEKYGEMSANFDNVILVCHGLTGSAHAAGFHSVDDLRAGWWDIAIGPGKMLDTDRYCIICSTVLGGSGRGTAPAAIDPATGVPFGSRFPLISIRDMVRAQSGLVRSLGISKLHAVVGGCMGGAQALLWGLMEPGCASKVCAITVRSSTSAASLALWEVVRQAIQGDPSWRNGDYYDGEAPRAGIGLAKMIALLHLIDDRQMGEKYGRRRLQVAERRNRFSPSFLIEYMMEKVGAQQDSDMDPNSLLYLTRAISDYDLDCYFGSLEQAFQPLNQSFLFVSYLGDRRYPAAETAKLVEAALRAGSEARHLLIDHEMTHGAFQYDISALDEVLRGFLDR